MRRYVVPLAAWLGALSVVAGLVPPDAGAEEASCRSVVMYSREGCPHCSAARGFLDALQVERPEVAVRIRDVRAEPEALARLRELGRSSGAAALAVPTFEICDALIVGFDSPQTTGRRIREALDADARPAPGPRGIELPGLGRFDSDRVGLTTFTLVLGLIDGFNPCAMWVLLILLSVLVGVRDRRKLVAIAGTFVVVSGLAYFAFMAAWLNVFLLIGWSRSTQVVLGLVALVIGAIHAKDAFAFHRGISLSIPDAAKPGIYARIRRIVRAPSLLAAMAGAFALAVLVNVVELLCTAGLPALYTQILTLKGLSGWQYYGYLGLYNLAYVFDDALMVTICVVTLNRMKLQEAGGRWLKGISGAAMLLLGLALVLRPNWLS